MTDLYNDFTFLDKAPEQDAGLGHDGAALSMGRLAPLYLRRDVTQTATALTSAPFSQEMPPCSPSAASYASEGPQSSALMRRSNSSSVVSGNRFRAAAPDTAHLGNDSDTDVSSRGASPAPMSGRTLPLTSASLAGLHAAVAAANAASTAASSSHVDRPSRPLTPASVSDRVETTGSTLTHSCGDWRPPAVPSRNAAQNVCLACTQEARATAGGHSHASTGAGTSDATSRITNTDESGSDGEHAGGSDSGSDGNGGRRHRMRKRPKISEMDDDMRERVRLCNRQAAKRHRDRSRQRRETNAAKIARIEKCREDLNQQLTALKVEATTLHRLIVNMYGRHGGAQAAVTAATAASSAHAPPMFFPRMPGQQSHSGAAAVQAALSSYMAAQQQQQQQEHERSHVRECDGRQAPQSRQQLGSSMRGMPSVLAGMDAGQLQRALASLGGMAGLGSGAAAGNLATTCAYPSTSPVSGTEFPSAMMNLGEQSNSSYSGGGMGGYMPAPSPSTNGYLSNFFGNLGQSSGAISQLQALQQHQQQQQQQQHRSLDGQSSLDTSGMQALMAAAMASSSRAQSNSASSGLFDTSLLSRSNFQ